MNSHIAITALKDGKQRPLNLPDDFSIDIDDQNPLFNDNEMFSYPCRMPMEGNRFLLGNIDDPTNIDRPVNLEHTKMRIVVDNQPFRSGTLVTSEDEEIDNALTMNISASEHSMQDLIGQLNCRDIPVKDKILIGEKIGNVKCHVDYDFNIKITYDGKKPDQMHSITSQRSSDAEFSPQALGFSYPGRCLTINSKEEAQAATPVNYADGKKVNIPKVAESYINVSEPYPNKPYCNARVAYTHYDIDEDGKTTSKVVDKTKPSGPNDHWPYWVLEADRPQSGICFYLLYFLDCLFDFLGVSWDNSELLKVEDMRHLCFFTTHCKYDEEKKYPNIDGFFTNVDQVNNWLKSRGCGGYFKIGDVKGKQMDDCDYHYRDPFTGQIYDGHAVVGQNGVQSITIEATKTGESLKADLMLMYANSDNFPDESVQTVLDSLWGSFGIKFHYDYEKKHVRAYFARDVFRSNEAPIEFPGKVISMHKVAEKITGVRMKYSAESDAKEQRANVKQGKKDYDTSYDYIDYPQKSTDTSKTYAEIFKAPKAYGGDRDKTCYIDKTTGNKYRIKVNGEATSSSDWKPALFEVGQFKGVEIGDCSELNDDFIEEIVSDFQPLEFNDVNYQVEITKASGEYTDQNGNTVRINGTDDCMLAPFIDEDMEHEFIEQIIKESIGSDYVECYAEEHLELIENYDPSDTEDGNSPLQEMDWGLAIALMRGGGTNATLQTYDFNYDGFGCNSKWRTVAGLYALASDSLDMWGNEFDYNGTHEGIGDGERFSLKIRSWKQPEWANAPLINPDVVNPTTGKIEKKIKSRGLCDTFMSELMNFVLKRRKYRIRIECSAAQVADVPNHWTRRFRINGLVGFINKLSYNVSAKDGLNNLEVEFYVL